MKILGLSNLNLYITWKDLLKNIWVILMAGVIGFFASFSYYNYLSSVEYTTDMMLVVNINGYATTYTSNSLSRTADIAEVLTDVFKSDAIKTVVEQELGEPIEGYISASQMSSTNLVTVSATSTSPMKAYKILKAVHSSYDKVTQHVFDNVITSVIKEPSVPATPSHYSEYLSRSVVIAALLMALITGLVILMSHYRPTLKNVSDIEKQLDTRLFGAIFHEKFKAKVKDNEERPQLLINGHFVSYEFSENFRKMAIKLESLKRTKRINSIMVTSVGENEGKTTCSVNLAMALSMEGNRVLLIDLDLKKPAVHYFFRKVEHKTENELGEYFKGNISLQDTLKYDPSTGLYLINSKKPSRDSSEILMGQKFRKMLRELEDAFDFVVIDTPPSGYAVDAEIISSLSSCAVLVARQDYTSVPELQEYLAVLNKNTYVAGCLFNNIYQFGNEHRLTAVEDAK